MITIKIKTGNEAFSDHCGAEVARILRELADGIEDITHLDTGEDALRDYNGNTVGAFKVTR